MSWSLLNTGIFIAILPTLILVALIWRFVIADLVRGADKAGGGGEWTPTSGRACRPAPTSM